MKIFHGLTAILILLKLFNILQISWLVALAPSLIVFGFTVSIIFVCAVIAVLGDIK